MPEVRRLLHLLTKPVEHHRFGLHWSSWRRAHQAVARRGHMAARARARPAPERSAPAITKPSRVAPPSETGLTDEQWHRVQALLPARAPRGRPPREPRLVLAGMLWIVHRHASWRELPTTFGSWRTIYGHDRRWCQTGLWPHLLQALNDPHTLASEVSL